jgi:hypothetical protein
MENEQSAAVEFLSVLSNLFTAFGAIAGVLIAWRALDTWRAQIRGQATFDAAKRFMIAVNELALQWHNARAPLVQPWEGIPQDSNEVQTESERYHRVFQKRWEPVGRAYDAILALLPEIRALFPPHVGDDGESLLLVARQLQFHQDDLVELMAMQIDEIDPAPAKATLVEQRQSAKAGAFAPYPRGGAVVRNALTQKFIDQQSLLARHLAPFLNVT